MVDTITHVKRYPVAVRLTDNVHRDRVTKTIRRVIKAIHDLISRVSCPVGAVHLRSEAVIMTADRIHKTCEQITRNPWPHRNEALIQQPASLSDSAIRITSTSVKKPIGKTNRLPVHCAAPIEPRLQTQDKYRHAPCITAISVNKQNAVKPLISKTQDKRRQTVFNSRVQP